MLDKIEDAAAERRVNYLIQEISIEFEGKDLLLAETGIPHHISHSDIQKLKPILRKYAKDPHPWAACYKDNYKRFGPGAAALCAKLKDIIRGTTKWRGHPERDHGVSASVALSSVEREGVLKLLLNEAGLLDFGDDALEFDEGVEVLELDMNQEIETDKEETGEEENDLVGDLKELLGNTITVYLIAHGFHWNVKGPDFAQYHELFGNIYEDIYGSVDALAENILKLGHDAPFTIAQLVAVRTISDVTDTVDEPGAMAAHLLEKNELMLDNIEDALECAAKENQQGILNFLAERQDMHQKWSWQLRASLGIQNG